MQPIEELLRREQEAEQAKRAALERLIAMTAPEPDAFETAMTALIDADKAHLQRGDDEH